MRLSISVGIVPLTKFSCMRKTRKLVAKPIWLGSVPSNLLRLRKSTSSLGWKMPAGMVPFIRSLL